VWMGVQDKNGREIKLRNVVHTKLGGGRHEGKVRLLPFSLLTDHLSTNIQMVERIASTRKEANAEDAPTLPR